MEEIQEPVIADVHEAYGTNYAGNSKEIGTNDKLDEHCPIQRDVRLRVQAGRSCTIRFHQSIQSFIAWPLFLDVAFFLA